MLDQRLLELFSAHYDGELGEEERLDFEELLRQDPKAATAYRRFALGQSLLDLLPRPSPSPKVWKNLKKELRARKAFGVDFTMTVDGMGRSIKSDPALLSEAFLDSPRARE